MTSWLQSEFEIFWNAFRGLGTSFFKHLPSILLGLVVFVVFLFAGRVIRRLIITAGERTRLHRNLAQVLSRLTSALITLLGVCVAAVVVFPSFKPGDLVAGLGITSVAIGFAFKDILQNFFAGILILWREPFKVGDQIRSGEYEGTVEEIYSLDPAEDI